VQKNRGYASFFFDYIEIENKPIVTTQVLIITGRALGVYQVVASDENQRRAG
jgi:hypothetical protein